MSDWVRRPQASITGLWGLPSSCFWSRVSGNYFPLHQVPVKATVEMWPQWVSDSVLLLGRSPTSNVLCSYFKGRSYPQGKKNKNKQKNTSNNTTTLFFVCAGDILIYVQFRSLQQISGTDSSSISSGTTCRELRLSTLLCVRGTRMVKYHVLDTLVPVPHANEITLEFCLLLSIYLLFNLFQSNLSLSCSSQCFARDAQNVLWMSPRNRFPGWWKLARLLQSQAILGNNKFGLLLKSLQVCKLLHEVV